MPIKLHVGIAGRKCSIRWHPRTTAWNDSISLRMVCRVLNGAGKETR